MMYLVSLSIQEHLMALLHSLDLAEWSLLGAVPDLHVEPSIPATASPSGVLLRPGIPMKTIFKASLFPAEECSFF